MSRGGGMRGTAVVLLALVLALVSGCQQGHRPDTAAVPTGPSSGAVGVEYTFSSSAQDRDGDDVAIRFDWGDGDTSEWSPWVRPGDTVTMSHTWATPGAFSVRARAEARNFTISGWSDALALGGYYEWTKTFGGAGDDSACSVQQTQDGGYIFTGYTESFGAGHAYVWLVKTDADGDTVWTRTYGGAHYNGGRSVQQTQDGGYIVVGAIGSDVWLIKTDANGDRIWDRAFGGAGRDEGCSVRQTEDGGYVVTGFTWSFGAGDCLVWLLKTDPNGDTVWTRTFGRGWCEGRSVQQTRDGGYVVAALAAFDNLHSSIWLIKTDASGCAVWTRTFGSWVAYHAGVLAQQTQDGGYIVVGTTCSSGGGAGDVLLIRTDSLGEEVWAKTFGEEGDDWGNSVQQTRDGGYIIAGNTSSYGAGGYDVWLIKTDAVGDTVWTKTLGGMDSELGYSVQQTEDGGFVIVGRIWYYASRSTDILLIKTDAEGTVDEGGGK